jgi:predicted transcriptional regulator
VFYEIRLAGRADGRRKGMSKAVLISIRPEWCEKIIKGQKTIEVRKTRPKMDTPFKCYIYCTKPEEKLITIMKDGDENYGETYHGKPVFIKTEKAPTTGLLDKRQKVIGEFVCDDIFERIVRVGAICEPPKYCICDWNMDCTPLDTLLADACLTKDELEKYLDGGVGYGWHISNLKIYDTPKELIEFHTWKKCKSCNKSGYESTACIYDENCIIPAAITKAPQSWCYVEEETWND